MHKDTQKEGVKFRDYFTKKYLQLHIYYCIIKEL